MYGLAETNQPKLSPKVRKLEKEYLPRLKQYHIQEQLLGERNSYSKTDSDATFMRTKEDHLKNSQLKPCYNVQLGTENQFVAGYSIHQQASDSPCCLPHLKKLANQSAKMPQNLITDSGYGCEETYEHLIHKGIGNYVKYSTFHQELKKHKKGNKFQFDDFSYDAASDQFTSPAGRRLYFMETQKDQTKTGYEVDYRVYQSADCTDYPLRDQCTRANGNRTLSVNFRWHELKKQAEQNHRSELGLKLRAKRSVEIESVFGQIKEYCF